jgi:hypothetical protein
VPIQVVAAPNPAHGAVLYFDVKLGGAADTVQCKVYTKAMTLVLSRRMTSQFQGGWNQVALPVGNLLLPNGLYYVVIQSGNGGQTSAGTAKIGRFLYFQ